MEKFDYGISEILPQLSKTKVAAVMKRVQKLGIPDEITLDDITENDLTKGELLKPKAAAKLVKSWQNGNFNLFARNDQF